MIASTPMVFHFRPRLLTSLFLVLLVSALITSCGRYGSNPETRTEIVFGTTCTVSLYDHRTDQVFRDTFDLMKRIDAMMSYQREDSNLSEINQATFEDEGNLQLSQRSHRKPKNIG